MELFETLPIAPPAERTVPTPPDRPTPVAIRPAPQRTRPPAATPPAATSTAIDAQRLQNQMRDVAAGMAREKAPHNALSKRDLQAFVPDRESAPDLRFEVNPEASPGDQLNRVLKMLQGSLPQAAFDLDAPSDLLTEGWERAHHSSDLVACMREYRRFDEDLQRQLCGEVRP
jgi:hypothetical protein